MPANSGCGFDHVTSVFDEVSVRPKERIVEEAQYG